MPIPLLKFPMASYVFHDEAHIPLQAHEGLQDLAMLLS